LLILRHGAISAWQGKSITKIVALIRSEQSYCVIKVVVIDMSTLGCHFFRQYVGDLNGDSVELTVSLSAWSVASAISENVACCNF